MHRTLLSLGFLLLPLMVLLGAATAQPRPLVGNYLADVRPEDLVPGGDAFGAARSDIPVVPVLSGGETIGHVFLTSDFVVTTGYSGKPIHVLVGLDEDGILTGALLVQHAEPIVLVGIPQTKIDAVIGGYRGTNIVAEAAARGSAHDLDIVSGATVTVMVIDDSILRASLAVARALGLGGLSPERASASGSRRLKAGAVAVEDWHTLMQEGSVRALSLDVGQVNAAFAAAGDARAATHPESGATADTFIDMRLALVSVPTIGRSLLGETAYANLASGLGEGGHAILLAARGRYSFKGSGYVRGGIFDRISLIQDDLTVRFRDREHRRLGALAADGSPSFRELDVFRIPAAAGFDPTAPFRLQLLVQRAVGPIEKAFVTFDLAYQTPQRYLEPAVTALPPATAAADDAGDLSHLWPRIWEEKSLEVGLVAAALGLLTGAFFFQMQLTRHEGVTFWFRIAFLTFTLVGLGWAMNAQLSVVNVLAFFSALTSDFSWSAFLMDPLIFILWFCVAASLIFWGRGVFCGWLCPFGALQELTNRLAKLARVPQVRVPWGLHERLWPVKYMIFLGLFGVSLYSLALAETYAEVEPFKTAIVLKFQREWPYVVFALAVLGVGLFVERFYCRYLCPLGAALAIPARLRMFEWLKRYRECGNPCQRCGNECMVGAIHPEGNINPNECLQCLHCQVLYQSARKCPVCIRQAARRARNLGTCPPISDATAASIELGARARIR